MARSGPGLLIALLLVLALAWHRTVSRTMIVIAVLAGSTVVCAAINGRSCRVLPDGRGHTPNNLAYLESSHLEGASDESWRLDGTGGLIMTLMRNGYEALILPELTSERLERAGLLISIAPARRFSAAEKKAIRSFVENGGIFVGMVGYEEPRRSALPELMAEYGFYLGDELPDKYGHIPEPSPLGHFKSPYYNAGKYMVYVRFHAAWPVVCTEKDARIMAYAQGDRQVMMMRRIGKGKVVFIGDTEFATNKNLEHEGGEPFEGMRENADFWRWALTYWTDQPLWIPPNPTQPASGPVPPAQPPPDSSPPAQMSRPVQQSKPAAGLLPAVGPLRLRQAIPPPGAKPAAAAPGVVAVPKPRSTQAAPMSRPAGGKEGQP